MSREGVVLALQKILFARVFTSGHRRLIGQRGLGIASEPPQQVGTNCVKQVVPLELEGFDLLERPCRAVDFGNHHGPVQSDDGAGREREELVVQREDLAPIRFAGIARIAMHCVDRGL